MVSALKNYSFLNAGNRTATSGSGQRTTFHTHSQRRGYAATRRYIKDKQTEYPHLSVAFTRKRLTTYALRRVLRKFQNGRRVYVRPPHY